MVEENVVSKAMEEIKNVNEDELKKTIEDWFERTRTDGLKNGARFIAAAVMGKIQKHLGKPGKASLRDYERCIADVKKVLLVQLTEQNDLKGDNTSEETVND